MATSSARTVAQYLRELPADRRATIAAVRRQLRKHVPSDYEEAMNWGMITYQVPLQRYPETRNGQPLCYAALAAQKHYNSLYLMSAVFAPESLKKAFRAAGKKLDMGKSCVRFQTVDDLPLEAIGAIVSRMPAEDFIRACERIWARTRMKAGKGKASGAGRSGR
jgi:hypothetical protein